MKNYLLPEALRTALMDYLKSQPYGAVAEGMRALEGLTLAPDEDPEPNYCVPASLTAGKVPHHQPEGGDQQGAQLGSGSRSGKLSL